MWFIEYLIRITFNSINNVMFHSDFFFMDFCFLIDDSQDLSVVKKSICASTDISEK